MQIHELKLKKRKARKTVGRGGKRGTYSGKGNKGQRARSGASIDPLFEGGRSSLIERLKKVRGFKSVNPKKIALKLSQLDKAFSDSTEVTLATLVEVKLISKKDVSRGVKVLGTGNITKKLSIGKDVLLSESAKNAIIEAGGKVAE